MFLVGLYKINNKDQALTLDNIFNTYKEKNKKLILKKWDKLQLICTTDKYKNTLDFNGSKVIGIGDLCSLDTYCRIDEGGFKGIILKYKFEVIPNFFWGNYILISSDKNKLKIIRPFASNISIYYYKLNSGNIVFSTEILYIQQVLSKNLNISLDYVLQYISKSNIHQLTNTPFDGINELHSGYMIYLSDTLRLSTIWNLDSSLKDSSSIEELPDILSKVLKCLLHKTPESKLILELSGGLDSSSILAALSKVTKNTLSIKALNIFYPEFKCADERKYIKKLESINSFNLKEINFGKYLPFSESYSPNFIPNKPDSTLIKLKLENFIYDNFVKNDSYRFISGEGGDHIFNCMPDLDSIADIILDKKWYLLLKKTEQIAMYRNLPLISIVSKVFVFLKEYFFNLDYFDFCPVIPWLNQDIKIYSNESNNLYKELKKKGSYLVEHFY